MKITHINPNKIDTATLDRFEFLFFSKRTYYQKTNFLKWVELNPITDFGNYLISRNNEDIYIVTTKNRFATEALLKHYKISVREIFANDEIKTFGTKGKLISNILDRESIDQAYFIDDSISHLETVDDNRIKCFFADWGYGEIGEKKDSFIEELRLEDIDKKISELELQKSLTPKKKKLEAKIKDVLWEDAKAQGKLDGVYQDKMDKM